MVYQTERSWETPTARGLPEVQLTSLPALLTQVIDVMGKELAIDLVIRF